MSLLAAVLVGVRRLVAPSVWRSAQARATVLLPLTSADRVNNASAMAVAKTATAASSVPCGTFFAPKLVRFLGRRSNSVGADHALWKDQFPDTLHVLTQQVGRGMSRDPKVIYDRRFAKGSTLLLGSERLGDLKKMYIGNAAYEMLTVPKSNHIIQKSLDCLPAPATNATLSQRKAFRVSFLQTMVCLNLREWPMLCRHLITRAPAQSEQVPLWGKLAGVSRATQHAQAHALSWHL